MEIINWPMLKNPLNWVTVTIMIIIAGIAMHLVLTHYQQNNTGGSN